MFLDYSILMTVINITFESNNGMVYIVAHKRNQKTKAINVVMYKICLKIYQIKYIDYIVGERVRVVYITLCIIHILFEMYLKEFSNDFRLNFKNKRVEVNRFTYSFCCLLLQKIIKL